MNGDHEVRLTSKDSLPMTEGEWKYTIGLLREFAKKKSDEGNGPSLPWMMLNLMARYPDDKARSTTIRLDSRDASNINRMKWIALNFRTINAPAVRIWVVLTDMTGIADYDNGMHGTDDAELQGRSMALDIYHFMALFALQPDMAMWRLPGDGYDGRYDVRDIRQHEEEWAMRQAERLFDELHGMGREGIVVRTTGVTGTFDARFHVFRLPLDFLSRLDDAQVFGAMANADTDDDREPGGNVSYSLFAGRDKGFRSISKEDLLHLVDDIRPEED